jgi:hypothetical protein
MLNCHCRNCQLAGGSAFSSSAVLPATAFNFLAGTAKHFDKRVESGNISTQGFCANCGTPLYALTSGHPEYIGVRAVTFDDPSWFKAEANVWVVEAQPWTCMDAAIPKLERSPEEI